MSETKNQNQLKVPDVIESRGFYRSQTAVMPSKKTSFPGILIFDNAKGELTYVSDDGSSNWTLQKSQIIKAVQAGINLKIYTHDNCYRFQFGNQPKVFAGGWFGGGAAHIILQETAKDSNIYLFMLALKNNGIKVRPTRSLLINLDLWVYIGILSIPALLCISIPVTFAYRIITNDPRVSADNAKNGNYLPIVVMIVITTLLCLGIYLLVKKDRRFQQEELERNYAKAVETYGYYKKTSEYHKAKESSELRSRENEYYKSVKSNRLFALASAVVVAAIMILTVIIANRTS